MQAQMTHVEETLNRAPFGDNGMVLSNIFASGVNIPFSSYGSPVLLQNTKSLMADTILTAARPEAPESEEGLTFRVVGHTNEDSKK